MPPVQWPVASLLALASWEGWGMHFWRQAASHPSGWVALSALLWEPDCEDDGALQLKEILTTEKPHLEYQSDLIQVW